MKENSINSRLINITNILKISYGLLFIIAGLDKFLNLTTNWQQYVNPAILQVIDYSILHIIVAIIEITLGILVLTKYTREGAYGIAIWFFIIILNLVTMWHYLDIAARDLVLAIGAICLAKLYEIKN